MKKIFNIELTCPFCTKKTSYNILTFKAKHECEHCQNDLIVRTKTIVSSIITLICITIMFIFSNFLGISKMGKFPLLVFLMITSLVCIVIVYKICCKLFGVKFLYAVDAQDPILLKRYKRKK